MSWIWVLRGAWIVLPVTAGSALAGGLGELDAGVADVAAGVLWAAWGGGLVAMLVPSTVSLTAVRVVVPAAPVAVVLAVGTGHGGRLGGLGLAVAAAAFGAVVAPPTVDAFVDGSSYGSERRFALRAPLAVLLGPVLVAWAAAAAGPVAGLLLLADERWAVGIAAVVLGVPAAVVGARALHGLSRRWVVFVPSGVVLHDHMAVTDPLLMTRRLVAGLSLAEPSSDGVDLSLRAFGTPVAIRLREPVDVPLGQATGRVGETDDATTLLFSPVRPGALLEEAFERGLA